VVPSNLRGTALGAFHTSVGLVMLPGGIIAGYLWDNVGHWATFAYGFVTAIAAIVLLLAVRTSKMVTPDGQSA
jgi:MFS family permease